MPVNSRSTHHAIDRAPGAVNDLGISDWSNDFAALHSSLASG
jgi:hypothetical protein